jgi:hypothetical protein
MSSRTYCTGSFHEMCAFAPGRMMLANPRDKAYHPSSSIATPTPIATAATKNPTTSNMLTHLCRSRGRDRQSPHASPSFPASASKLAGNSEGRIDRYQLACRYNGPGKKKGADRGGRSYVFREPAALELPLYCSSGLCSVSCWVCNSSRSSRVRRESNAWVRMTCQFDQDQFTSQSVLLHLWLGCASGSGGAT